MFRPNLKILKVFRLGMAYANRQLKDIDISAGLVVAMMMIPQGMAYALVAGLPEQKIRVISPDVGGGFGNKVGVYPGYVLSIIGSIVTGKPVKWMEDRNENLVSTSFARDYHMHGTIAATKDGKITAIRANVRRTVVRRMKPLLLGCGAI